MTVNLNTGYSSFSPNVYPRQIQIASSALFLLVTGIAMFIIFTQCRDLSTVAHFLTHQGLHFTATLSPLGAISIITFIFSSCFVCRQKYKQPEATLPLSSPVTLSAPSSHGSTSPEEPVLAVVVPTPTELAHPAVTEDSPLKRLQDKAVAPFFAQMEKFLIALITSHDSLAKLNSKEKKDTGELASKISKLQADLHFIRDWMQKGFKDFRFAYIYALRNVQFTYPESMTIHLKAETPQERLSELREWLLNLSTDSPKIKLFLFFFGFIESQFKNNISLLTPGVATQINTFYESLKSNQFSHNQLVTLCVFLMEHVPLTKEMQETLEYQFEEHFIDAENRVTTLLNDIQEVDLSDEGINRLIEGTPPPPSPKKNAQTSPQKSFLKRTASNLGTAVARGSVRFGVGKDLLWNKMTEKAKNAFPSIPCHFDSSQDKDAQQKEIQSHLDDLLDGMKDVLLDGLFEKEGHPFRILFKEEITSLVKEMLREFKKFQSAPPDTFEPIVTSLCTQLEASAKNFTNKSYLA